MALTKASYAMIDGAVANVLDYGADPTNTTDSTSAIQAAIASGNAVYIPKGEYKLTGQLTLASYQIMYGDGPNSSILRCDTSVHTNVFLLVNGRCTISDFALTGNTSVSPKVGVGVYLANSSGQYNFTGHSSVNDVQCSYFSVGFQVNNYFDLEFNRCESTYNLYGFAFTPYYSALQDSGYYTTITMNKCYAAFNSLEGIKATSTVNGRVLHIADCAIEFNGGTNAQIDIRQCFYVSITNCYTEYTATPAKPWLYIADVSPIEITGHWDVGSAGILTSDYTGQITIIQSAVGDIVGATVGGTSQRIWAQGSSIGTVTVASTVPQTYIDCSVNGTEYSNKSISKQIAITSSAGNTTSINNVRMYTKTVTATISANSSANLITDYYIANNWAGDTLAYASVTNIYAPGLILTVTPSSASSKEYFCVVATNTTASPITLTSAELKVLFTTGYGMAI